MNARKLALATLLLLLPRPLLAAPLSLQGAVDEAMAKNPSLQRAGSALKEAKWHTTEQLSGFLPTVGASASHLFDKKYALTDVTLGAAPVVVPQIIPSTTYNLSARLPIFDGFANVNRYKAASGQESAAELELDWARFQLEREVVLQYYRAIGARQLEEVAKQNLRTLEDHLKDVNLFKKAGVSTNYDVLRVEVQVSEARSAVLDAADNVAIALNRLGEALGHEGEDRELAGSLPVLPASLVSKLARPDPAGRSDLAALGERTQATSRLESAAAAYIVPKLNLFGDYQRYNNRDNALLWSKAGFRDAYQVGISLSWNLFDGMASFARSKQSVEQSFQAEKNLELASLKSHRDFDLWRRKFLYSASVYASRVDDVEKATEAIRLARAGRKVGARTNTELLDAEADLFRSRAGLVNAQLGAIEALLNLELASGQDLYNFQK
jgi:outer membrane protein TolC